MSNIPAWESHSKTFLRVFVRPNSKSRAFMEEITAEYIVLNLRAPAKGGKANAELVKRLSKKLRVPMSHITIASGHKSREKIIEIEGISAKEILQVFQKE